MTAIMSEATGIEQAWRQQGWWLDRPLVERYRDRVRERPDALAVVDDRGVSYTHHELWTRAARHAATLGPVIDGQRRLVVCLLPNTAEYQAVFLGILMAGGVPATVPVTTDESSLTHMLNVGRACALIVGDAPEQREAAVDVVVRATEHCSAMTVTEGGLVTLVSGRGPMPLPHEPDLAHLMFTSSTTGTPKAVIHTEQTLSGLNVGFQQRFGLTCDTPIFMPSPLGHSVGGIHGIRLALHLGCPLVLQDRWDPERAVQLIVTHRAAFTAAATPFLSDLVRTIEGDHKLETDNLSTFLCGGAQVPPALIDRALDAMPATLVTVLWGMTEGGVTTCLPGDDRDRLRHTAGCGLPGLELRTLAPDGLALPPGAEGELAMRGPGVFRGYLANVDLNQASFTSDGFFRTGDRAVLDNDGYVTITGRIKDLIIRGGVNISPVPTENALASHPDIDAVAVVGFPDERLGERLCAVVHARRELTLDELVAWCDQQGLPKRLWPERIAHTERVPRTAAGKIRKHELRDGVQSGLIEVAP